MWEIYAYQNADSLFGIFNAAATIHGSGDYMAAVAAVAFCGFIAALVAYAFAPEKLQGWKWLATVLLVFSVLIVPRVTVGVVDKTGGSAVKVVANVPFGVAFLGSVTSTVGHTLTGLFETAFQVIPGVGALPSELSYEKNGLMFGNRLIRETGGVAFQDPNFRTDLVNFIHNCTMYDLIDGTVDPGTFSSSDDVWALMASPNPARFTTLTSAGGSITVDTCPNAYTNLNGRLPAQLTRIQGKLAFQLNPTLPAAAANAAIAGQIQQAYLLRRRCARTSSSLGTACSVSSTPVMHTTTPTRVASSSACSTPCSGTRSGSIPSAIASRSHVAANSFVQPTCSSRNSTQKTGTSAIQTFQRGMRSRSWPSRASSIAGSTAMTAHSTTRSTPGIHRLPASMPPWRSSAATGKNRDSSTASPSRTKALRSMRPPARVLRPVIAAPAGALGAGRHAAAGGRRASLRFGTGG